MGLPKFAKGKQFFSQNMVFFENDYSLNGEKAGEGGLKLCLWKVKQDSFYPIEKLGKIIVMHQNTLHYDHCLNKVNSKILLYSISLSGNPLELIPGVRNY